VTRVAVVGLGALGARAARQLASTPGVTEIVLGEPDVHKRAAVAEVLGPIATDAEWSADDGLPVGVADCDAALLAGPAAAHVDQARRLIALRRPFVSTADARPTVQGLLDLGDDASQAGVSAVVGAAFSPGLSCALVRHGATWFDAVDEVHVAWLGTGGPACAHQHHRNFAGSALEWHDGAWIQRPSGSGRELCWFPDPVGSADCYRGDQCEPLLLQPALDGVSRITARMAGTRRDRMLARLPMLRPPHPEGAVGALRVEIRGRRSGATDTAVLGAIDRPAVAGAAVAALATVWAGEGRVNAPGVGGVAVQIEVLDFLTELARRGIRAAVFEGSSPVS
jgi:saccharopine dehydrogenase-like NADP-dependent oxidoreductase